VWIWSYFLIPKQYNPTIIVPAFQIEIPAIWLDAREVNRLVVSPLEDLIMELEWIDEVYWYSYDNYAWLMAKFNVWVNNEYAKIRLIQKINENLDLKPLWVWEPKVTSIDSEELSQITYAISYIWDDDLSEEEIYIYLRQIANLIKQEVRTLKNITTIEIVWWYKKDIIIDLDLDKIKSKNVDILWIYETIKNYNLTMPSWDIRLENDRVFVEVLWRIESIEDIKKIVISTDSQTPLYLEDVAEIREWVPKISSHSRFSDRDKNTYSVLIWFWKQRWTNSVNVTNSIIEKIDEFKETLPKDISIDIIQNEWKIASDATNMLLINMLQSVIIVFIILAFYLWVRDAFNTALSIPLTLSLVFLIALIIWDNINRITLFALILILWMIVDNSTVVVENISRHLKERIHTWASKLEAVLRWVQEVWFWTIMATLTRLLAFGSMFAVWWVMWEYMWPIPKYAIFALVISLMVALAINPWISYLWASDLREENRVRKLKKENKYDPRKIYLSFMKKFIGNDKKTNRRRKIFKVSFWLVLFAIIIWPIYLGIFNARMLPKSDQNQIYVWIDAPRGTNANTMLEIENYMTDFFLKNPSLPKELDLVENITSTIWQAFIWDFSNLFRWWSQRFWEHQISSRINLIPSEDFKKLYSKKRLTSEKYTISIRDDFKQYMLEKYPDLEVRLQEDSPGPPVSSTLWIKIKWSWDEKKLDDFLLKVQNEVIKIADTYSVEDIWNTLSTTYRKVSLKIDNSKASLAWITTNQISHTLGMILWYNNVWIIKNYESFEENNLVIWVKESQVDTLSVLKNIYLTNRNWKKIPLDSLVDIEYSFVHPEIITDKRKLSKTIYAEMWDNSLVYPVIKLFTIFLSNDFMWDDYKLKSWNPYSIKYIWLKDWEEYIIEWWWEWELTVDTFRDLGLAMWISLLAIYFLLVGQFASFWIAWIIMITFLLWFFWVFPWFSFLYLLNWEYFSATSMIWVIALAWIVVWNAIILIDYLSILKKNWLTIENAVLKAWYVRFAPIILTSLTTVFWASTIIWDPVWSGLAWSIIWWLLLSSILTLIVIPIFYYDSQKREWDRYMETLPQNIKN